MERPNVKKHETNLSMPISPAFVNNYKLWKDPDTTPILDYCRSRNIPFKIEESRFYKLNQSRQHHKAFSQTISNCFENRRPSQLSMGIEALTSPE